MYLPFHYFSMTNPLSYDDQHLPAVSSDKYRSWLLWLVLIAVVIITALLSKTLLFAEEKLVVCPSPYVDQETCTTECGGDCSAALFANSKPVCFECKNTARCPAGLPTNKESCVQNCAVGICTTFNQINNCFVCAQCPTGSVDSLEKCAASCATECVIDNSSGLPCYTCKG